MILHRNYKYIEQSSWDKTYIKEREREKGRRRRKETKNNR